MSEVRTPWATPSQLDLGGRLGVTYIDSQNQRKGTPPQPSSSSRTAAETSLPRDSSLSPEDPLWRLQP